MKNRLDYYSLDYCSNIIMSTWPWMKDSAVALAQAVPDDSDPRPVVSDLIEENQELIDRMVEALSNGSSDDEDDANESSSLFDHANKHDDLWCLRFLLSHKKNLDKAVAAARTTLKFRHEHKLDEKDLRNEAAPQYPEKVIGNEAFCRFMASGVADGSIVYTVPEPNRSGVVAYINIGSLDTHQLGQVELEDWVAALTYANEWNYQWLDYLTRTTGRLTKSIRIVDVSTSRLQQFDNSCQQKYTDAIAVMQDCFPQAVKSIFVCFAPAWIQVPWRVIRPFMPVRVVDKLDFLHPLNNDDDRARLLEIIPKDHLPTQFGGTNTEYLDMLSTVDSNSDVNDDSTTENELAS